MEFSKETNLYSLKQKISHLKEEQPLHCEINLPEYFLDVTHVLKCSADANIYNVQSDSHSVFLEGTAILKVFYSSDDQSVRCYTQSIPFSKTLECSIPEDNILKATANTEYLNCRVLSPRKMEIHGALSLQIEVFTALKEPILCACNGCGVETKQQTEKITNLLDCASVLSKVSETLELAEANSAVHEIIRTHASAKLDSTKIVSGKVLVKGTISLKMIYLSAAPHEGVETMTYALPFSQIVEVPQAKEDAKVCANLWISGAEVEPKADASGAMRLLESNVVVGIMVQLYKDEEKTFLLDAYSTEYNLQCEEKNLMLLHLAEHIEDTFLCRSSISLEGLNVQEIFSIQYSNIEWKSNIIKGMLQIHGTVHYEILYANAQGEWETLDKKADFSYERAVPVDGQNTELEISLLPTGMEYLFSASDHVDVRLEFDLEAMLLLKEEKHILSDITVLESQKKKKENAALTIYFANAKENLWDIARQYNTTVLSIQKENQLKGESLEEKCTLFIPRA